MNRTEDERKRGSLTALLQKKPGLFRLCCFYRGFLRVSVVLLCLFGTLGLLGGGAYVLLESARADSLFRARASAPVQSDTQTFLGAALLKKSLWLGSVSPNVFLLQHGGSALLHSMTNPENTPMKQLVDESVLRQEDIYAFDRDAVPPGENAIIPMNLSRHPSPGEILFSNTTAFSLDGAAYAAAPYPIDTKEVPTVLILHTHATESYAPQDAISYNPDTVKTRTSDTEANVVAVGDTIAAALSERGISVIHCRELFDAQSYPKAYETAAAAIRAYLRENPQIGYVFDVHRDALCRQNGDEIKPLTEIGGEPCAQVMLVVGTNEAGANHPHWEQNLTVAAHIQSRLTTLYSNFARPINIRSATFNEQYTKGSLLLEIGSFGNTLAEAQTAAKHLGQVIADVILGAP